MNTTDFLALCESNPAEANRMVAEAAGWKSVEFRSYPGSHSRPWRMSPDPEEWLMGAPLGSYGLEPLPDFVASLDAAWPLAEVERVGASLVRDEAHLLAGEHGLSFDTDPKAAARCICAAFLEARGKLDA